MKISLIYQASFIQNQSLNQNNIKWSEIISIILGINLNKDF